MIENIIWLALGLLVAASFMQENKLKLTTAGAGWLFFSVHWALQWRHYFELGD